MKGRTRTVEDILDYTERFKVNGRLIAIDFKKAFDSVSREFFLVPYLLLVLALLLSNGFTLFIIIFLAVFQTVVLLLHILTSSMALGGEGGEGGALSPYLFTILLETLASTIRSDNDILC